MSRPQSSRSGDTDDQALNIAFALEIEGRVVRRSATSDDANIALPCPGSHRSLSGQRELRLDTIPPRVEFVVSLRSSDVYVVGEVIDLQVGRSISVVFWKAGPAMLSPTGFQSARRSCVFL
jgi:hypothetical protein